MSGDAHVLRLSRDSLVPMDGSVALVRSGQVAIARFAEEALAAERKAAHAVAQAAAKHSCRQEGAQAAQRGRAAHPRRRAEPGHFRGRRRRRDRGQRRPPHDARVLHGDAGGGHHHPARPRRPVEADLSVHGRSLPPRLAGGARQGRGHRRRQVRGRRLLHPPRPVGVDDAARAQDRRLHRVQGMREGVRGALRRQAAGHQRAHPRQPRLRRRLPHLHRSALHRPVQLRRDLVRRAAQGGPHQGGRLHRLHAVRDRLPVQRHRDARARRGADAQAAPQQGGQARLRRRRRRARPSCAAWPPSAITAPSTRTRRASPPARPGALVEILPSDAVTQLPEAARASAKAGYDRTVAIDVNNLNESKAFVKGGLDIPELGRARAPRKKLSLPMWWTLGIGAFLLSCTEIAMRLWAAEVLDGRSFWRRWSRASIPIWR